MKTNQVLERCPACGSGAPKILPSPEENDGVCIVCVECDHVIHCKVKIEAYAIYKWNIFAQERRQERIEKQTSKKKEK